MDMVFMTPDDPRFDQVRSLRHAVLRAPLGIPYEADWDDHGRGVRHLAAVDGTTVLGYGRVVIDLDGARIRYMCVDPEARGGGIGTAIVNALVERAREERAPMVWLNARLMAVEFYRRLGFTEVGGLFDSEETHLPHKRMEMRL